MAQMDDVDVQQAGRHLAEAACAALPRWVSGCVASVLGAQGIEVTPAIRASMDEAGSAAVAEVGGRLRRLLAADVDDQDTTPLTLLRGAVRFPAAVLAAAGAGPVERDPFAVERFPDDVYGLSPASFADISPALAEAGLAWGAAKAWEHRRRHRGSAGAPPPEPVVLAHVPDLMDRSKISAALPSVRFVARPGALVEAATEARATLVIVDLGRAGVLDALPDLAAAGIATIGFGSHVDEALLAAARAAGCTEVLPRSKFFARLPALQGPSG